MQTTPTEIQIIRLPEVIRRTGLSRSTVFARIRPNPRRPGDFDKDFPKPIQLGARAIGWYSAEITAWLESRHAKRA